MYGPLAQPSLLPISTRGVGLREAVQHPEIRTAGGVLVDCVIRTVARPLDPEHLVAAVADIDANACDSVAVRRRWSFPRL